MNYDPKLLDLIKSLRAQGHSTLTIKMNKAVLAMADNDQAKLDAAVDYYDAELEDQKELMLLRLDSAILQLTRILAGDGNKGSKVAAARVLVAAIDRYSKLLGLDSPIKVDSTQRTLTVSVEGVDMRKILEDNGYDAIGPSQDS